MVSNSYANRPGLHGKALKLTVKGINTEEVMDTKLVELTLKPRKNNALEYSKIGSYLKENLVVGADIINNNTLEETCSHLSVLDRVTFCFANIEMILELNMYHAIRPLKFFAADEKCSRFAVGLPMGSVLRGLLPSSSGLIWTGYKAIMKQDFKISSQVKFSFDMESYGALRQADPKKVRNALG